MSNKRAIGLMDSGVGGLTILNELTKQMPHENYIYIGDNARAPYGTKSVATIKEYTEQMVNCLLAQDLKALVIACNTITAHMLKPLQKRLDIPVFGVIEPAAKRALAETKNKQIGVIATDATIAAHSYQDTIMQMDATAVVVPLATQPFVDLVEANEIDTPKAKELVSSTLAALNETAIDTLILGCTHFLFLKDAIQASFTHSVTLVEASTVIPDLLREEVEANEVGKGDVILQTTGDVDTFAEIASDFLSKNNFTVKKIELGESINE